MHIVFQSSWQALKDVAYMYIAAIIMSFLTILHLGNFSQIFVHAGWGFLAVSLHLLASIEFSCAYHRDNSKDKLNRKVGGFLSVIGLIASIAFLSKIVDSSLNLVPIKFPYFAQSLWILIGLGTFLRYFSRNISLQRAAGRYA